MMDARIGVSEAKKAALQKANQPIPAPQVVRALVDTGASCLCIDPSVLKALGLQPTGKASMTTPTTGQKPVEADEYDVSVVIPCGNLAPFVIETVACVESELLLPQGFHVLVGRDVLKHCILHYNGAMQIFTIAY